MGQRSGQLGCQVAIGSGQGAATAAAHVEVDLRPGRDRDMDAVRMHRPLAAVGVRQDVDARPHARQLQAHHLVHVPAAQQLRFAVRFDDA